MNPHFLTDALRTTLVRRAHFNRTCYDDEGFYLEDICPLPFWYSRTGVIVKWSVFLSLLLAFSLYLVLGYAHARKRIRKGLPPLAYHRWLISRAELARVDPRYAYTQPQGYSMYRPDYYGMHAMPPPVYDANAPRPPMYQPPDGATSKVDPNQTWNVPPPQQSGIDGHGPPPGPPPAAAQRPQGTGNPFSR